MVSCMYCGNKVNFKERCKPDVFFVRGVKVEYDRISAHCPLCNRELYVPDIHDLNCLNRERAYKDTVKVLDLT